MNARFQLRLDKDAFCHWVERQDGKYEWKEGRVVQMTNVTKGHARIASNLLFALRSRLETRTWSVTASDLGVEGEDFIRYPDIIVEPMDADDKGRRADHAVLLAEVLSASTSAIDLVEKRAEYESLPSLAAYLVVSQDEPIVWLWERDATGAFPRVPREIAGRDASVEFAALAVTIPLADVYRGVGQG